LKTVLISYANKPFYRSQVLLHQSAKQHGIYNSICYDDIWIRNQKSFYEKNKFILSQKRGNGYWLWKPFIILNALKQLKDGEVLIHIDAGTKFVNSPDELIKILDKKEIILFYNNGNLNSTWTKRDCFYYMNCDTAEYHKKSQVVAGYLALRKTKFVVDMLEEWLHYAQDERIITDNENICGLPNYPEFKDHRHDQSILTNLAIKYNIELFRDPSQWGNKYKFGKYRVEGEFTEEGYVDEPFYNSTYPTLLDSHRSKLKLTFLDECKYFFKHL
jgi:hypothetical protein